jgi:hypothetical protein
LQKQRELASFDGVIKSVTYSHHLLAHNVQDKCPDLEYIFVKGADCYLTTNLNPSRRLAEIWQSSYCKEGIFKFQPNTRQRKRTLKEVYQTIQSSDWSDLNVSRATVFRWKSRLNSSMDIDSDLVKYGEMEFAQFMSKKFKTD